MSKNKTKMSDKKGMGISMKMLIVGGVVIVLAISLFGMMHLSLKGLFRKETGRQMTCLKICKRYKGCKERGKLSPMDTVEVMKKCPRICGFTQKEKRWVREISGRDGSENTIVVNGLSQCMEGSLGYKNE